MTCKVTLVSKTTAEPQFIQSVVEHLRENGSDDSEIAEVIALLQKPEGLMTYIARVSSPNQSKSEYAGLLRYCMKHGHWSVFEMVDMTVEIETSRMIAPQILRHRSFNFQEFSQRYASVGSDGITIYAARRQDIKNRQNSHDDVAPELKAEWERRQLTNWRHAFEHYQWALDNGIAKECARAVLPLATKTRLYMKGNLRSWIHYVQLRGDASTQKEHRDIALAVKEVIAQHFPIVAEAMYAT